MPKILNSRIIVLVVVFISIVTFPQITFNLLGRDGPTEEEQSTDIEDVSLLELLDVQVTVASKTEESTADAPSSVSVFTQKDILDMGITHLEELLNFAPGFQATRDIEQGLAYRISARGRSTALSESILFIVNGQRINDLYTGGISIINRLMAVENIKQVEIIRGPGSALYGSNAFLGVVNIVTEDESNRFIARVGSQKSKMIALNFHKSVTSLLHVSAFVKAFSDEGFVFDAVEDVFGQMGSTSDPARGFDAYISVKYENLTLNGRYMERHFNDFLTFGGLANHTNNENTRQASLSAAYTLYLNPKFQIDLRAEYLEDQWQTIALLLAKDIEIAPGFALSEDFNGGPFLESYHLNFSADASFSFSKNHFLAAGVTYMSTGITGVKNLFDHHPITLDFLGEIEEFSGVLGFNEEKTRNQVGLYIQDKLNIGKHLSITAGVRLDKYNDFGSAINPRAALIYSTSFGGKFKVMYGTAFRAPNFLELYDKNNPVDFGNPDLEPERIETIEIAYIQKFKHLQATVTYFHNKIKDLIILGEPVNHPDNPLGAPAFNNEGEEVTNGIEFEIKANPAKNLIISGTFSHLLDGETLFVPSTFASFAVNYKGKGFNLNVNGLYRQKMDLLPSQDSYWLINSAARVTLKQGFEIEAAVKNLLDTDYQTFSLVLPQGVYNRGLTFSLGLISRL
jgi:outer membrane cobalamin receptor